MYDYHINRAKELIEEKNLNEADISDIYRYQQMLFRIEDVKNHANDLYNNGQIKENEMNYIYKNADYMAWLYISTYQNCELAENDVFETLIIDFLNDNYREV